MATKRGPKAGVEGPVSNGKAPAPSPANAWARPLKTTGPPPGMGPADKSRVAPSNLTKKQQSPQSNTNNSATTSKNSDNTANGAADAIVHRERLLHLSLSLVGQKVVVLLLDGTVVEGVFHTFTPFDGLPSEAKNKYVLNTVKVIKAGKGNNIKDGYTCILSVDKVACVHAKNVNLDRPNTSGGYSHPGMNTMNDVITDTQISGQRRGRNREFVAAGTAWTTNSGSHEPIKGGEALEDAKGTRKGFGTALKGGDSGGIGAWDQFKANEELFNVNASFDENLYTTALDKSQIDKRKIAEAERIAREIETSTSTNIHVAEERGHVVETDFDEEDRYSGVLTKDGKQRHDAPKDATAPRAITPPPPAPKKIMNYAAAAAKADAGKKTSPPGFSAAASKPVSSTPKPQSSPPKASKKEEKVDVPSKKEEPVPIIEEVAKKIEEPSAEQESKPEEVKEKATQDIAPIEAKQDDAEVEVDVPDKPAEEKKEAKEVVKTSKLNANAKEFTFNPAAKSFTPGGGVGGSSFGTLPPQQQQPQHMGDPNMQMHGGHPMQAPPYMHPGMGQPGMMHLMPPQYHGMRYPPQFIGIDQHGVPQMQPHQPQHVQAGSATPPPVQTQAQQQPQQQQQPPPPPTGTPSSVSQGGAAPTPQSGVEGEASTQQQDGDQSSISSSQQQQPPQQQPMPMTYGVPPHGAYYAGGAMTMHPRGPGYPQQFVGGPQQIPLGPAGGAYRQMYPMPPGAMPPTMTMRVPSGGPYYPNPGPMPYGHSAYGHGMMDDGGDYRGRGRAQGRGRGRRPGRGGRGMGARGHYQPHQQQANYNGHGSGRSTPQQNLLGGPDAEALDSNEPVQ